MRKLTTFTVTMALALMLQAGCTTHRESVTTTETRNYPSETTVQRTETQTTTDTTEQESGVLSSTVNVVGEVIALPFRAVGALFRAIF